MGENFPIVLEDTGRYSQRMWCYFSNLEMVWKNVKTASVLGWPPCHLGQRWGNGSVASGSL